MTTQRPGTAGTGKSAGRTTRPIEWVIAIAGGLALAALLVWILRHEPATPALDAAPSAMPTAAPTASVAPLPPPVLTSTPVASAGPDLSAIKLRGIIGRPSGASAMLEIGGGKQLLVRVGSAVMSGVTVSAIGRDHVMIDSGGTSQRLDFGDAPATALPTANAAAPRPAAIDPRVAALAATSTDWRIGLAAERRDGRIIGFAVVDSARLPLLRRAGLKPGDIITAINGSALASEEKIIELPGEIAGAYAVELAYVRSGTASTVSVPVNR